MTPAQGRTGRRPGGDGCRAVIARRRMVTHASPSAWRPSLSVMRAVQITRLGGPEVLDVVDLPDPVPGDGEQLYEVSAAGINFADTHQTENSYLAQQQLPLIPGTEFVGTAAGGGPRVVGLAPAGGY